MFGFVYLINRKLIIMKKLLLIISLLFISNSHSQDLSSVYRQVEEITLKEGITEKEYLEFEAFWKTVKEKHIKEGKQIGWFVWKVDPTSNNNKAWAEYIILNVFANKKQMDAMFSNPPEWYVNEIRTAHKGKTKRSIIKKYTRETMDNKYRGKSVIYNNKGLAGFLAEGAAPAKGIVGYYHGIEQLNEDYVDFETQYFAQAHQESGSRAYWELNEIMSRSDNAYKPVTHTIFEIPNPEFTPTEQEQSFTDKMMLKYGIASRKIHGSLKSELALYAW